MTYKAVVEIFENEIIEKKSRFITNIYPIKSEDDVKEILGRVKKDHHQARHHCFAFRLVGPQMIERYSDDGEPGGTAGMPMLEVLRGEDLENTLVVTSRYFGGVKLGTGGLVRAYTLSVQNVIAVAEVIEIGKYVPLSIEVDYAMSGKIEYHIKHHGYLLNDAAYGGKVTFHLYVDEKHHENIEGQFVELANGNCNLLRGEAVDAYIRHNKMVLL